MIRSFVLIVILLLPAGAGAQSASPAPRLAADIVAGYAGFLDDEFIGHTVVSGTLRYQLTRRVSIGPELVYMVGPGEDRDLFVTGNLIFDFLLRPPGSRAPSVNPYIVIGGGMMRHSNRFGDRAFSSVEGAWTAGAGARVWMTNRVYALGEYRVGWEPHTRLTGGIGTTW